MGTDTGRRGTRRGSATRRRVEHVRREGENDEGQRGMEHGERRDHCQTGVRRAYEKEGVTVIAAAAVAGGAGGGSGTDPNGQEGEGGGFGAGARPVGAYVVKNGEVTWRPAVDANRIITMVGLVLIAYLLRRPRGRTRRRRG